MTTTLFIFIVLCGLSATNSERLREQIYSTIEGGAACFRRLNGTHQVGCSSNDKGAVGAIQMIYNVSDAQWMVTNGTAGPYMAVVSTTMFNNIIEILMASPHNVAGVLIYDNATDPATSFSQESRCPNEYSSGPGSQCSSSQTGGIVWNEVGTGLLRRDIPFPMFLLPDSRKEEIVKIEDCYQRFNLDKSNQKGKPLCSLQLYSFMFAAINSEVCLRRSASSPMLSSTKVCDPLGDHNVYYSLFPRTQENPPKKESITFVTARIDTASLFDGVYPGAASSTIGLITLLTTAVTLSQMIPVTDAHLYDHNVLFTLFNGEAFDYIGSQRVAFDLNRGVWPPAAPLNVSDIKLHVELGQIGGVLAGINETTSWPLHAFAPYENIISEISEFINELSTNLEKYNMSVSPEFNTNLPPSSLHSFRRILYNITVSGELPEMVITDHKDTFTNMFYNSALDDYEKIGFNYHNITVDNGTFIPTDDLIQNGTMKPTEVQVKIARLATGLANTLYQRVTGTPYVGNITPSAHLVDEMMYCFLRSQACRLLMAADYASESGGNEEKLSSKPAPLYVGVAAWAATPPVFAGHLLALLAGPKIPVNRTKCNDMKQPGFSYYWLNGWNHTGVCVQTTMNFSQAVSPAFIIKNYDMSSGRYSSWTESVWQAMWARVFVSAGGAGSSAAAAAGALVTILTLLLTYWFKKHKDLLFPDDTPPARSEPGPGILRTVNC